PVLHTPAPLKTLASAPLQVEGEAARAVATDFRLGQLREQLANRREQSRIGRRVGTRRPTDRALIDVDDLVDVLEPRDRLVLTRDHTRPVEMPSERAMQNVLDERRL